MDSVINLSQLLALSKKLFIKRVGRVSAARLQEVDDALRRFLSLVQ
jgi:mRNA-degrading endonuclease toxin of MazEF toxin-antitoxin module